MKTMKTMKTQHEILARLAPGAALLLLPVTLWLGCERQRVPVAPVSGRPAVYEPVGPIPGPGMSAPGPANPYLSQQAALAEGRRYFVWFNCAGCHGDHGGGGMGPSLRDEDWIYGGSDADVFDSIAEGRAHGMPAWGTKLPQETVWKLAAYIASLRTPGEPEPPR